MENGELLRGSSPFSILHSPFIVLSSIDVKPKNATAHQPSFFFQHFSKTSHMRIIFAENITHGRKCPLINTHFFAIASLIAA